jgi:lambda repressor-like predicted transcriptional regulator
MIPLLCRAPIVREGLDKWVRKLREIAGATVTDLAKIAQGHPEWVTEDPTSWARGRTKELLDGYLNAWRTPRIVIWFRQGCDGPDLDFDQYEHGRPEPWCAPTWAARSRDWTNDPANLDERLTPELTQKLLLNWRRKFDATLKYGLDEAEHTARVSIGMQPPMPVLSRQSIKVDPEVHQRGMLPKSACSRQSILQSLLNGHGWSTNDLAVKAGVDFHTANRYLKGSAKSYPSTRKKLADALGVRVEELPD